MSTGVYNNNDCHRETAYSPLQLLTRAAATTPDHPALEYLSESTRDSVQVSYGELLRQVHAVAEAISTRGLKEDDSVAILLPFVPEAVPALIAATAVCTAFPVNLLLSAEAIRQQLLIARCRLVITLGAHPALDVRQRVSAALEGLDQPPAVIEVPMANNPSSAVAWADFVQVAPEYPPIESADRVAMLIHTGGTTGQPKLARLSLRNMAEAARMAASGFGIGKADRLLTGLPLFHVGGAIDALLAGLAVGATIVFPTLLGMRNRHVVERIWALVDRFEITLLVGVPTTLAAIVDSPVENAQLGRLRAVMTGGAPLPKDLWMRLQALIGKPVCQLYGMTESSGIATAQLIQGANVTHTVGKPAPGAQISLGKPGAECKAGASGEIFIRGANLFQGYLTANGVVDDPQGGWFGSGDLGQIMPNGELKVVGRSKDVIIRSGHNIDPQLIEDVAHSHYAVAQAAAVAMPDDYAGEIPILFIVAKPGTRMDFEELAAYIASRIAEPPARPKHLLLLDELPLTAFAKIARFRLRQMAVEFRVRQLLTTLAKDALVTCDDPQAKRVQLTAEPALNSQQLTEINSLLARFQLQLEH